VVNNTLPDRSFLEVTLEVLAGAWHTPIVEKVDKNLLSAFSAFQLLSGAGESMTENRRDK
jgi:hypothetical protein